MAQPFFIHMALSMAVKHLICINYDLNFLNRWHCATVKINRIAATDDILTFIVLKTFPKSRSPINR